MFESSVLSRYEEIASLGIGDDIGGTRKQVMLGDAFSYFSMILGFALEHRDQLLQLQLPHLHLLFSDWLLQSKVEHSDHD